MADLSALGDVFRTIDLDDSQIIMADEVLEFVKSFPPEKQPEEGFITTLVGPDGVNEAQFGQLAAQLQEKCSLSIDDMVQAYTQSCYKKLFDAADDSVGESDGTVDRAELRKLVEDLQTGMTANELLKFFEENDDDNSGAIDFDEFVLIIDKIRSREGKPTPISQLMHRFEAKKAEIREARRKAKARFEQPAEDMTPQVIPRRLKKKKPEPAPPPEPEPEPVPEPPQDPPAPPSRKSSVAVSRQPTKVSLQPPEPEPVSRQPSAAPVSRQPTVQQPPSRKSSVVSRKPSVQPLVDQATLLMQQLHERIAVLEADMQRRNADAEAAERRAEELRKENERLREENAALATASAGRKGSAPCPHCAVAAQRNTQLEQRLRKSEEEASQLTKQLRQKEKELAQAQARPAEPKRDLAAEAAGRQREAQLQQALERTQILASSAVQAKDAARQELAARGREVDDLRAQLDKAHDAILAASQAGFELDVKLHHSRNALAGLIVSRSPSPVLAAGAVQCSPQKYLPGAAAPRGALQSLSPGAYCSYYSHGEQSVSPPPLQPTTQWVHSRPLR
eukprot:TRINITY_DN22704_c0_g1_i1.p1 TRINITY_DN22704_c0_g1~~TRINITY_DN22704_c0_g1_i1.p1  ORF type:complete len:601 (+),score=205.92 TRINITY_DN22704_c0_g1_i1:114-1805(+)